MLIHESTQIELKVRNYRTISLDSLNLSLLTVRSFSDSLFTGMTPYMRLSIRFRREGNYYLINFVYDSDEVEISEAFTINDIHNRQQLFLNNLEDILSNSSKYQFLLFILDEKKKANLLLLTNSSSAQRFLWLHFLSKRYVFFLLVRIFVILNRVVIFSLICSMIQLTTCRVLKLTEKILWSTKCLRISIFSRATDSKSFFKKSQKLYSILIFSSSSLRYLRLW